jgi:hypothetical protein
MRISVGALSALVIVIVLDHVLSGFDVWAFDGTKKFTPDLSPLQWKTTATELAGMEVDERKALIENFVWGENGGACSLSFESGILNDSVPMGGESMTRGAIRVLLSGVKIQRDEAEPLALIDLWLVLKPEAPEGTQVLTVYTKPADVWAMPNPNSAPRDPEDAVRGGHGWVGPLTGEKMTTPLVNVLTFVWRHGIHPGEAGQIIVRPRSAMTAWPPPQSQVDSVASALSPGGVAGQPVLNERQPYWLVQVLGTELSIHGGRFSSVVMMLPDRDHVYWQAKYLP